MTSFDRLFVHSDINIQLSSTACWNASFLDQRYGNYIFLGTLAVLEFLLCSFCLLKIKVSYKEGRITTLFIIISI